MDVVKLSRWLSDVDAGQTVAYDAGRPLSKADLESRIRKWQACFSRTDATRWAVYHSDAFEFLAILLALWTLQRIACVPGDNRPGTVESLYPCVDAFAGEFDESEVTVADSSGDFSGWPLLNIDYPALEIYTSGSSGKPAAIAKTIGQLERESLALAELLPASSEHEVILGTVSHQHFYGMTFRLFRSLAQNLPFDLTVCEYAETVISRSAHYDAVGLISSPALLARLNAALNWSQMAEKCNFVLSSAAALSAQASGQTHALLCAPVLEIYGSSETGAVAWRDQQKSAVWQAIPGVELDKTPDECLRVSAPFLPTPVVLADQVRFVAGGFDLRGRADRIVKVEGKRVSLTGIENRLLHSEWVREVKAIILERRRTEVAAVIELSDEGLSLLQTEGKKALVGRLKGYLKDYFEAVAIPRRWRFPSRLPYNPQGKLTVEDLTALFNSEPARWPDLISQTVGGLEAELRCRIPAELVYFDGHFAQHPILPGITQIHWAERFGRDLLAIEGQFLRLEVVKFQQVITPDSQVLISLSFNSDKQKLTFSYTSDKGVHSSGRICFG